MVWLEKYKKQTKEKNSILGLGTCQLSCLLFSWKTFLTNIIAIVKVIEAQFFNPSSTDLLTGIHWAKIQYYLGLSLEIVTLQGTNHKNTHLLMWILNEKYPLSFKINIFHGSN